MTFYRKTILRQSTGKLRKKDGIHTMKDNINDLLNQKNSSEDNKPLKEPSEAADETSVETDTTTDSATSTKNQNNPFNIQDKDLLALQQLPQDEWLWYFIDDVVPTPQKDTEILLSDQGVDDDGMPVFTMIPKSLEILDMINDAPAHAAQYYPEIVKFFPIIQNLHKNVIVDGINPYWAAAPINPPDFNTIQTIFTMFLTGRHAYLSLIPKPNSIPCRLIYGDSSHKHDYVGIVFMHL